MEVRDLAAWPPQVTAAQVTYILPVRDSASAVLTQAHGSTHACIHMDLYACMHGNKPLHALVVQPTLA